MRKRVLNMGTKKEVLQEEEQIRQWVRHILDEEDHKILREYASRDTMYDVFIAPFTDVLNVGKLVLKNVLTDAKFMIDSVVYFDPIKLQHKKNNYKKRKKAIREELDEAMKPTKAAMGHADLELALFALNPAAYMGGALAKKGIESIGDAATFFREVGFGGPPSEKEKDDKGLTDEPGIAGTAFKALKKLFFLEAVDKGEDILIEQGKPEQGMHDIVAGAMEEIGLGDSFRDAQEKLFKTAEEDLSDIYETFAKNLEIVKMIESSESVEELNTSLDEAKAAGMDMGGPGAAAITQALTKTVDGIMKNPAQMQKFTEVLAEREGVQKNPDGTYPQMDPEAARPEIEKVVYANSSDSLRDSMTKSREKILEQLTDLLDEVRPGEKEMAMIGQTPEGQKYLKLFADFDAKIAKLI